ncbi:MAG: TIGR02757 family protein [Candidatus Eisenbacteria bacterium]
MVFKDGGRTALLKAKLDELYSSYDLRHLHTDPLVFPHRYGDPLDKEIVAFFSAALAYGNVKSIQSDVEKILAILGPRPHRRVLSLSHGEFRNGLGGFRHRFTTARHTAWLFLVAQRALSQFGSLKALFLEGHSPGTPTLKGSLVAFVDRLASFNPAPLYRNPREAKKDGAFFLLPSPRNGGACKRLNLFMRWVVRRGDSIDLGLWPEVSAAQLIVPVDTHVARISRYLGLTKRRGADWKTAEEITEALRKLDPADPLKYDFSLTRLGIMRDCVRQRERSRCSVCALEGICGVGTPF